MGKKKHGRCGSKVYRVWIDMRRRCNNPEYSKYPDWGGRGITVCKEWGSFEQFFLDMGDAPIGMSLDRINNDKGYSKENCRWATQVEQGRNTRSSRNITFNGETQCLSEWAHKTGVSVTALHSRLKRGWSAEQALTTQKATKPILQGRSHIITFEGATLNLSEWAQHVGLNRTTLNNRLTKYGWSVERALTTPVRAYGK